MGKAVRPPYASAGAIRNLFGRIPGVGAPKKVDTKWVDNYGIQKSQPEAIVGLLRWLGVVDDEGKVDEPTWKKLRTDQAATLADLITKSYATLFETVDVENVDLQTLQAGLLTLTTRVRRGNRSAPSSLSPS